MGKAVYRAFVCWYHSGGVFITCNAEAASSDSLLPGADYSLKQRYHSFPLLKPLTLEEPL
jgi:hypothetical protein